MQDLMQGVVGEVHDAMDKSGWNLNLIAMLSMTGAGPSRQPALDRGV